MAILKKGNTGVEIFSESEEEEKRNYKVYGKETAEEARNMAEKIRPIHFRNIFQVIIAQHCRRQSIRN